MQNEAIRSLRTQFLSSLLIIFLWLLIWPTAVQKFREDQLARDLHAWLYLKDRMEAFGWDQRLRQEGEENLEAAADDVQTACGEDMEGFLVCTALVVETVWPDVGEVPLVLSPTTVTGEDANEGRFLRIYSVSAPRSDLPFDRYEIVVIREQEAFVVPSGDVELRQALEEYAQSGFHRGASIRVKQSSTPMTWKQIALHLAKHGFRQHPLSLALKEPAVTKFATEADTRFLRIQVFGMPVPLSLFISAVGLLLAAISFTMLGPILTLLRRPNGEVSSPWVLVVPTGTSPWSTILEIVLVSVSVAWIVAPALLLYLQITTEFEFQETERLFLIFGRAGLVFACAVYSVVSFVLWRLRRAAGAARSGGSSTV